MQLPWYLRPKHTATLVAGLGGLVTVVNVADAQPWAQAGSAPSGNIAHVAVSADGSKLVLASFFSSATAT